MSHLPFMKFFPADWLQDTRVLTLEAAGGWMHLLCALWVAPTRGRLTWSVEQFATFWGVKTDKAWSVLNELESTRICDVTHIGERYTSVTVTLGNAASNAYVTVESRRMIRESNKWNKQMIQTRERVRRFRSNAKVTHDVTQQMSDVRSHNKKHKNVSSSEPDDVTQGFSVSDLVENWNECFAGKLPSVVLPLSHSRAVKAAARIREHQSFEFWESVFKRISASGFLLGSSNGNGWRATFDWLIANDRNCLKVFEGSYNR